MLKWYIAVVIGLGSPMLAALSLEMEAAQTNTCDSNSKVANLDFVLKDMNGRNVMLSAYKGKVILLDFWATWCAPCRIEIPGFIELYNKYRSRDFVVLGVSMDETSSPVKPFVQKLKMNYPVLIGTGREPRSHRPRDSAEVAVQRVRMVGGDQRARALRRFDDDGHLRQRRHDPVARRERPAEGTPAWR